MGAWRQCDFTPWRSSSSTSDYIYDQGEPWEQLFSLSRVCRQLHQETHLLPIRLNVFSVFNGDWEDDKPFSGVKSVFTQNITAIFFKRGLLEFSRDYRLPDELPDFPSLTTVFHWIREEPAYLETVRRFAEERGLQLVAEDNPWH